VGYDLPFLVSRLVFVVVGLPGTHPSAAAGAGDRFAEHCAPREALDDAATRRLQLWRSLWLPRLGVGLIVFGVARGL
jgi:hypothetical protein